ncbi:MAG: DUF2007 domain-containing protein [Proteobacteria bacterium]|nr:DUF2007 domain-containing protein [Pseudomonadota bacterium]
MIPIYQTDNPVDFALAESLLTSNGIPYFVHNRYFGGLYPGATIGLLNAQMIMVAEECAAEAEKILADFLRGTPLEES